MENCRKSFIRINGKEHNLKALLDLLVKNGIIINSIVAQDARKGAIEKVTPNYIPSLNTQITVETSYQEIREILESSDEFKEHANRLLGVVI